MVKYSISSIRFIERRFKIELITIIKNTLLYICLPFIGVIFYVLGNRFKNGVKNKQIYILAFIFLDQGIKLFLGYLINVKKYIINSSYIFLQKNEYGSFLGSILGKKSNIIYLIILNVVLIYLIICIYKIHINKYGKSFWSDMFFIFMDAGLICSLIDKVFFGGSLDYMNICNIILVDIKDIYFVLSMVLLLCEVILNEKVDILLNKN